MTTVVDGTFGSVAKSGKGVKLAKKRRKVVSDGDEGSDTNTYPLLSVGPPPAAAPPCGLTTLYAPSRTKRPTKPSESRWTTSIPSLSLRLCLPREHDSESAVLARHG